LKVVTARTLDEALVALRDAGPDARILAGGTDLMVELESGRTRPDLVVDVWKLDALRGIRATENGLEIGALATCSDVLRSAAAREHADILVDAARTVGAVQIQNRATLGGNLGTASPAADLVPALFALDARVNLVSAGGERWMPVDAFVRGYRSTARAHDELIASIGIPRRPAGERRAFRKVGTRRAQSIAKVVVALAVRYDGIHVGMARIAAGSVADRTVRLRELETSITGREMPGGDSLARACADAAERECTPRDDVRSTAEYRRTVLARLLRRLLENTDPSLRS
jgi:CO/xanthine dehydrogenase FAD-binding subunit